MAFSIKKLKLPEVYLISPQITNDYAGYEMEIYSPEDFKKIGIKKDFTHIHYIKSKRNVLRGMRYQLRPAAEAKLVSVMSGRIFGVVVDIREGSPHFRKWISLVLDAYDKKLLYVPEGFAFGYCVLSGTTEIMFCSSHSHEPKYERGLIWNDPSIGIKWPVRNPILTREDINNLTLEEVENNFVYQ